MINETNTFRATYLLFYLLFRGSWLGEIFLYIET